MRVKMLGRDIEITRQTMLSDGYCLSTVKHAERISAAGNYVVDDPNGDTPGVVWLREHMKYCRQCWCANAYKGELVRYVEEQHPGMITAYHQGRLSKDILSNGFMAIRKKNPDLMDEILHHAQYNMLPPNLQAAWKFQNMLNTMREINHVILPYLERAQVVRIDTELVFDAWQLIGSEPDYDKDKLVIDWESQRIKPPFPNIYLSFSEGINDHLVEHFFDNMPKSIMGMEDNIRGVFFHVNEEKRQYWISEDPEAMSEQFVNGIIFPSREQEIAHSNRMFLWLTVIRAMQNGVFYPERGEGAPIRCVAPQTSPWVKDKNPAVRDSIAPFYMIRASTKKSFRDPTRVYGHRHINWTHRWNVTGHWRHYKDGRKVWIGTYVKGPEDRPLVPSVRVYSTGNLVSRSGNFVVELWRKLIRVLTK